MAPSNTNLCICFSGSSVISNALNKCANVVNQMPGKRYISLGGVNDNGRWTVSALVKLLSAISRNLLSDYEGIAYYLAEGDAGLSSVFAASFRAAKAKKLSILVSFSHSQSNGIRDGSLLIERFLASENIDYISPQLYTSGAETSNDFTTNGIPWSLYAHSKAKIVPSVIKSGYYSKALSYFSQYGISLAGYIQWSQG